MAHVAFAVSLPEHVERFDPLRRRIPGSEFVLMPGRWPGVWDSRAATLLALHEAGAPRPLPPEARRFDTLLFHGECPDAKPAGWLAPGGRLLRWCDPIHPSHSRAQALAGAPAWLESNLGAVAGDPRLDAGFEPGSAARARARMGSTRSLLGVVLTRPLAPAWSHALTRVRTWADITARPLSAARLVAPRVLPAAWCGPGVVSSEGVAYADLLTASDLVVSDHPAVLWDAAALRTRALGFCEGFFRDATSQVEAAAGGWRWVTAPDEFDAACDEILRCDDPWPDDPWFRPRREPAGLDVAALVTDHQSIAVGSR